MTFKFLQRWINKSYLLLTKSLVSHCSFIYSINAKEYGDQNFAIENILFD